jgi:hypothetical protein
LRKKATPKNSRKRLAADLFDARQLVRCEVSSRTSCHFVGDFHNDFEKYLVVAITLAALLFAMWRFFDLSGKRRVQIRMPSPHIAQSTSPTERACQHRGSTRKETEQLVKSNGCLASRNRLESAAGNGIF